MMLCLMNVYEFYNYIKIYHNKKIRNAKNYNKLSMNHKKP